MMNKAALNFSRIFVGVLFIFSGLIKANDTLGFGYKLEEYFEVFHIPFLSPYATGIAMLLCVLEIVLGVLLLCGFWNKKVATGLLGIIIFFTFLTFVSAAFKVVTSCGCFGDAIPLTPWESFTKDLILLVMIVYLFIHRESIQPVTAHPGVQKIILISVVSLSFIFAIYTYNYLPVVDFLPYKVGASIPDAMKTPEGALPDEYQINYNLKNKKTGETKEITDKEYLSSGIWKDNNWEVVGNPESKLIKKGFSPKIQDLSIKDEQGTDYTQELLGNPFNSLIIVAHDLSHTDTAAIIRINALAINLTRSFNTRTILLTSATAAEANAFAKRYHLISEIFYADAVPLKSMVRANPGVVLLKGGTIVNKWHYHTVPAYDVMVRRYFMQQ